MEGGRERGREGEGGRRGGRERGREGEGKGGRGGGRERGREGEGEGGRRGGRERGRGEGRRGGGKERGREGEGEEGISKLGEHMLTKRTPLHSRHTFTLPRGSCTSTLGRMCMGLPRLRVILAVNSMGSRMVLEVSATS